MNHSKSTSELKKSSSNLRQKGPGQIIVKVKDYFKLKKAKRGNKKRQNAMMKRRNLVTTKRSTQQKRNARSQDEFKRTPTSSNNSSSRSSATNVSYLADKTSTEDLSFHEVTPTQPRSNKRSILKLSIKDSASDSDITSFLSS